MTGTPEQLFRHFRARGDARALGELFDRTSGELLGLALHLCGHPADAEDALQATFVTAIDRAATYDEARPLLPWLCGILTVHCRRIGERRARRRETVLPDGDAGAAAAADGELPPLAAAERRELVAALRQHVGRLPDEQRQVVLLQLEHGLAPGEVAEVLGVAPGTVRMRLHRALAALRGLLPAGLVAALGTLFAPRGIAAVRAAVVQHASAAAAAVTTTGAGVLLMKKFLLVASVLVALVFAVAIAPWGGDARVPAPEGVGERAAADLGGGGTTKGAAAMPAERRVADGSTTDPVPPPAGPESGALLVTLRYRTTARPVPNLPIRVVPQRGDLETRFAWLVGASDGDGRHRFEGIEPGEVRIEVIGGMRATATVVAGELATAVLEFDEGLASAIPVRGQVVHADGRPAGGAEIVVGKLAVDRAVVVGTADAGGRFAVPLAQGLVLVGARLAGFAPSTLRSFRADGFVQLVLPGPGAVLDGTVVGPDGAPLSGADVVVGEPNHSGQWVDAAGIVVEAAPPQHLRTDAEGRFRAADLPAGEFVVEIRAAGCAPFWGTEVGIAGATLSRRFALAPGFELAGRVVDENDAAVAGALVGLGRTWSDQRRTTGRDGRFAFRHLAAPARELVVTGPGLAESVVTRDAAATGEWVIRVERGRTYRLRLVDEVGTPLAAWRAELHGESDWSRCLDTDADGRVALVLPGEPRQLRIAPPFCIRACVPVPLPPGLVPGGEATIVVGREAQPAGELRGRVVTADGVPLAVGSYEVMRGEDYLYRGQLQGGAFCIPRLPAGDLLLHIHRPDLGTAGGHFPIQALAAGERRDLGDLRLPADGLLRLHVAHADGSTPRDVSVFLHDAAGEELRAPPADASAHAWPIGEYTYQVMADDALWESGAFTVRAGQPTVVDVVLRPGVRRRVEFPVPAPEWGAPTLVAFTLRGPDGSVYDRGDFDPRQELPYSYAPTLAPGRWRLELALDDGRRFAGDFEVDSFARVPDAIRVAVQPAR